MNRILFLLLLPALIFSQETLTDLSLNPKLLNVDWSSNSSKPILSLPFIDDFSYDSPLVDNDLWEKSSVFVNRTYPINPPTIGVATFDGLDEYGLARDFSQSSLSAPSDTLLSKTIDLGGVDSAYFLFFYQPKGIGDQPQVSDSLILEFKDINGNWDMVWHNICDTVINDFRKKVIILKSSDYLASSFQFRFRNYATISGNFDHWHIDYVKLDEFIAPIDIVELNDMSFVYNSPSFLKRYSEMPWTHFLNYEMSELKDSIDIILRNNNASINVDYQYTIFEYNNPYYYYPTSGPRNESVLDYDLTGNFSFTNPPIDIQSNVFTSFQTSDTTTFIIKNIINTAPSDNKSNDTLNHMQNFHYYFSYDDGIAESAYGINVNGAKLAYEFKLNRPDTLRAVQMYFPQMLDSVNDIDFNLTIWKDINGMPGDTLYSQTVSPVHSTNGSFHTYYIDRPFRIVGTFYVGWEQNTSDLLNIGFDKNNEANQYMFYNVGSGWNTSAYPGSWMIRPIVSQDAIISTISEKREYSRIYPNPSSEIIMIETQACSNVSIYNAQGVLVKKLRTSIPITGVNISDLSPSVYFVEIISKDERRCQKMIVE
ncbi:MAG: hypothetical protein CMD16_04865 [Flavobacteriales bacterium]|mgnify:CR=1 FL=1|nr:hypothetical protein [Flavobacteriales bacterium]